MERTLNFAIVGCGAISRIHANCLGQIENARLAAAYDTNAGRLADFCREYSCEGFSDLDALLSRDDIDAVTILTPSGLHGAIGEKAVAHGKHIVMEKPLETTMEKAAALIRAARRAGVKLCCISQHRFDHGIAALKRAIADGDLGTPCFGASHTKWYRSQEYYDGAGWRGTWEMDGGGALMNQSIHYIDLLRYLMGEVEEVSAYCATRAHQNIEVEDVGVAAVRFASGAVGLIEGNTTAWPGLCARLDIYGTGGSVVVEDDRIAAWNLQSGLKYREPENAGQIRTGASYSAISLDSHRRQYEDIVQAILENRDPLLTAEDAAKTLALILAVYRSAESGCPVNPQTLLDGMMQEDYI